MEGNMPSVICVTTGWSNLQEPASIAPLNVAESMTGTDKVCGVFVLGHDRQKASELVEEFLSVRRTKECWKDTPRTVAREQGNDYAAARRAAGRAKDVLSSLRGPAWCFWRGGVAVGDLAGVVESGAACAGVSLGHGHSAGVGSCDCRRLEQPKVVTPS